jgi:hypothetical protein
MNEDTFTFTARSARNPDQLATFTLTDGIVKVELGNAILEQVEKVFDAFHAEDANRFTAWIEPATTGALQRVMQPIPVNDFDAALTDDSLRVVGWMRAGGLRLAPIVAVWPEVDNPAGARAFVDEIQNRKEKLGEEKKMPDPFDYWISWILAAVLAIALPITLWRLLKSKRQS